MKTQTTEEIDNNSAKTNVTVESLEMWKCGVSSGL